MSQENVDLVRAMIEARSTGDVDWLVAHADEDTEIHSRFSVGTEGEPYKGRDGMRQWVQDAATGFAAFSLSVHDLRDLDDGRVLALGYVMWRGRQSGVASEEPFGWVCEFSDHKLVRLLALPAWKETLEAVGLRE